MEATLYSHSLQSEIVGEYDEEHGLGYFRGIPYATVQKRWTHSTTRHDLPNPFIAKNFGPRCPQEVGEVLVSGGVNDPTPGDDEFNCLNLNICVPRECLEQFQNGHRKRKVPVMFWIHGGGFRFGANSVARYRPHALCHKARASGRPIILVQVGYRLGPLGFAASNVLKADNCAESGNYGFEDQRNALRWVRQNIEDFGGDPDNVTAFGVSAGSSSVHYHILTGDPMFDKGICMSGTGGTVGPLPFEYYQKAWDEMCHSMNLQAFSGEEQLKALRSASVMDILQNYSKAAMGPMADGAVLPLKWTFDEPLVTRCRSLILGDTNVEGIILDGIAKKVRPRQMIQMIRNTMTGAEADEFCQYFNFTGNAQEWLSYRDSIRQFLGFMMFQYPNLRIAETFEAVSQGGKAHLYHFEEASPFPGPTFGLSYHGQCALYMYGVENDALPATSQRVADEMASTWIAFAYDVTPWEAYTSAGRFMRYGPDGVSSTVTLKEDKTRNYECIGWMKKHDDAAMRLARALLLN